MVAYSAHMNYSIYIKHQFTFKHRKLHSEITLPDSQCDNCTLQLTRQAAEWSTTCAPGQYIFWSCADINVKKGIIILYSLYIS